MATFDGIKFDIPDFGGDPFASANETFPADAIAIFDSPFAKQATHVSNAYLITNQNQQGYLPAEMFTNQILLDRIYFSPTVVNQGFITQDSFYSVKIWNAHNVHKEIATIQALNALGTNINYGSTPILLTDGSEKIYTLTIYKDGPPFQGTTYIFTIDGADRTLVITGQRIDAFLYDPDWQERVHVKFKFGNIRAKSNRFVEQRRPLFIKPVREINAGFWFNEVELQEAHADIRTFNGKVLGVPIWTEPLTPTTSPLLGVSIVTVVEDFAYFFSMINLTKFVLIRDKTTKSIHEIKEIASYNTGSKTITFTSAVITAFVTANTVIYPIALCTIADFKTKYDTDAIVGFSLAFQEFRA